MIMEIKFKLSDEQIRDIAIVEMKKRYENLISQTPRPDTEEYLANCIESVKLILEWYLAPAEYDQYIKHAGKPNYKYDSTRFVYGH